MNKGIWNAAFWKGTAERVLASIIGAALAMLTGDGIGIVDVGWVAILNVSLLAGLVSLLKAVAAGLKDGNPSVGSVEVTK